VRVIVCYLVKGGERYYYSWLIISYEEKKRKIPSRKNALSTSHAVKEKGGKRIILSSWRKKWN